MDGIRRAKDDVEFEQRRGIAMPINKPVKG
jgi:hypothetical protein